MEITLYGNCGDVRLISQGQKFNMQTVKQTLKQQFDALSWLDQHIVFLNYVLMILSKKHSFVVLERYWGYGATPIGTKAIRTKWNEEEKRKTIERVCEDPRDKITGTMIIKYLWTCEPEDFDGFCTKSARCQYGEDITIAEWYYETKKHLL